MSIVKAKLDITPTEICERSCIDIPCQKAWHTPPKNFGDNEKSYVNPFTIYGSNQN